MFERRRPEPERPVLDRAYLARLGELAAAGDLGGVAQLGHDLVGIAGHLGLARLSVAAAEMNRAARDANGAGADPGPAIAETGRIGAESAEAIRRHLREISAR